jgi:hypothetical protein
LIEAKSAGKTRRVGIRSREDTSALQKLLKIYGDEVDSVMLPFSLPANDEAVALCRKTGISIIGAVDREAQADLLDGRSMEDLLPSYMASRVLSLNAPQEIETYATQVRKMTGAVL